MMWVVAAWAAPEPTLERVAVGEAEIALHHTPGDGPPVVLVHGVSCNAAFFDLSPDRSLVDALWDAGFDVWAVDLRGHGDAAWPPVAATLDDYGSDVAAALRLVAGRTGRDPAYVGHSMGGIVLAYALVAAPDLPLRAAVIIGSPIELRDPDPTLRSLPVVLPLARGERVPTPAGAELLSVTRRDTVLRIDELVHNRDNLAREAELELFRRQMSPVSPRVLATFAQAIRGDGELRTADGVAVRGALAAVHTPMSFFAGRVDHIVSPDRVRAYHDAVGSTDKTWWVAARANGAHADYGHLDLVIGDHAPVDVFPRIVAFLAAETR
ncbi:MAG: alpha/beta fold hydrolase [Myxococcota bacterium]